MGVVQDYRRFIHWIRSAIWKQPYWVWCNAWIKMRWYVEMRMLWHSWTRLWCHTWIRIIRMILMVILSLYTPWNSFLRKTWVVNDYSIMVIRRKLAGLRPMCTSVITITIKTWLSTNITLMMGGRRSVRIPVSIFTTTITTLSNIEQGRVADIFRPTSVYWSRTPTISY